MADDDLVVADEDFLHEKAQHASAFDYIERIDGRTQAVEEARHGFGETQTNFLLLRLVFAARSTLQNLNFHARRAILVNTVEKIVGTQQKLDVYGCIPIRNHVELRSSDRHRLNVNQHAHSLKIPFQLQLQLPPPRITRNIVDRDEAGRIVKSVPPMADRSEFPLAA